MVKKTGVVVVSLEPFEPGKNYQRFPERHS